MLSNLFALFAPALRTLRLIRISSFLLVVISFQLSAQKKNVVFTDITSRSGIDFKYTFGDLNYENILESSGSGITVFDYNNDNLMDLFMMNGTYI